MLIFIGQMLHLTRRRMDPARMKIVTFMLTWVSLLVKVDKLATRVETAETLVDKLSAKAKSD